MKVKNYKKLTTLHHNYMMKLTGGTLGYHVQLQKPGIVRPDGARETRLSIQGLRPRFAMLSDEELAWIFEAYLLKGLTGLLRGCSFEVNARVTSLTQEPGYLVAASIREL